MNLLLVRYGPNRVIVHGGGPGVDQSNDEACEELSVVAEPHLANRKGLANVDRPARNRDMARPVTSIAGGPVLLSYLAPSCRCES